MKFWYALLFLPVLFLTGCDPSPQQRADLSAVHASGVTPAIYDKMLHGDALTVGDIKALSHARVNEGIMLRYMRDQGTVYFLSSSDIESLRKAGISDSVIDYMLATGRNYYANPPVTIGVGFGYYDDPWFCGPSYYHHHGWR